ncbi:hypothetical protein E1X87_14870, partial [Listeria monocytogenes]|nr:hypothetical protein [Listeria monocytogenes]
KRKTEKSHETLTKVTAYPPKTWLIYSYKLTTSKTFSFFPLFRMKIPNSQTPFLTSVVYSLFPHWFFDAKNEKKNREIS